MENINFKEMNLSENMNKSLSDMGFEEATPIQSQAIPIVMEGKDVIGLAQTGTGKTYAFGIPALEKIDIDNENIQVLVLCPTRELAIQTCDGIKQLTKYMDNIKIVSIYGGQQIDRQISALKKKPQIVVGTPGRVMDHLRRKTLKLNNISMLVLDEADEMLNMGFREDIDTILESANNEKQVVLFSATMSKGIKEITKKYQKKDAILIEISQKEIVAPKISQCYMEVKENLKSEILTRILDTMDIKLAVVFCNTKRKVEEVTKTLSSTGYIVEALHGDIKQSKRDSIMKGFRNGKVEILVATDVAARGIDVDDVDVVFNYDVPIDVEYYVHRIGRTGRAGKVGKAYTFVAGKEIYKLRDIMRYTKADIKLEKIPSYELVLDKKVEEIKKEIFIEYKKNNSIKYVELIENIIKEDENITTLDIAAILLKREIEKTSIEKFDNSPDAKFRNEKVSKILNGNIVRMFVNMGKIDGFNASKLREVIINDLKVPNEEVTDIKILEKFSFVNIGNNYVDIIIKNAKNIDFNGRILNFEVSDSSSENTGVKRYNKDKSQKKDNSKRNRNRDDNKSKGDYKRKPKKTFKK